MYSSALTLNASNYSTIFTGNSGSLSVPVEPSAVIYSQLDYVHGISTSADETGVPVNKIRILNTLINQLVTMKKDSQLSSQQDLEQMNDQQKDNLIKQYQQQVQKTIAQAEVTGYGTAGVMPEAGALFNIKA